ncbi:unnamed protein product [Periconia digitata]|uniref:PRP38-assoc multi-domain protein n=1 Tax=Periconia digitata TaxID=1303443 RepID=A0A9W4XMW4_9PLEO|nr:unnamed protein product [Periconia digitata]
MAAAEYYLGTAASEQMGNQHYQQQPAHPYTQQHQPVQQPPPRLEITGPDASTYSLAPEQHQNQHQQLQTYQPRPQPPPYPEDPMFPPYPNTSYVPQQSSHHPSQQQPPPNTYLGPAPHPVRSHSQPPRVRFEDDSDSGSSDASSNRHSASSSSEEARRRHHRKHRKHRSHSHTDPSYSHHSHRSHSHSRSRRHHRDGSRTRDDAESSDFSAHDSTSEIRPRRSRHHHHRSPSSSSTHRHHRRHRSEHADDATRGSSTSGSRKDRDTFLGAGAGGLIGDAIFPGLGAVGGLLLGGYGGRKHGDKEKKRSRRHHGRSRSEIGDVRRTRDSGESGWDEDSATFKKGTAVR